MPEVYIGPWSWNATDKRWESPHLDLALGTLDFRTKAETDTDDIPSPGPGVFALSSTVVDANLDYLGNDIDALTGAQKSAMESKLGLSAGTIQASTLRNALWECLTEHGDPTWASKWKPLGTCMSRCLELHLGGFGLIKHVRLDLNDAGMRSTLQGRLREGYKAIHAQVEAGDMTLDQLRRVLGGWSLKHGIHNARFYTPPGYEVLSTLKPRTRIRDNFGRPDADPLGSSSDGKFTWIELILDADIVSNTMEHQTVSSVNGRYIADKDLSSDDHFAQAVMKNINQGEVTIWGCNVRKDSSSDETLYYSDYLFGTGGQERIRICKVLSGTITLLGQTASTTVLENDTIRAEADGSTIRALLNGVAEVTVTDTAIADNFRTGVTLLNNNAAIAKPRMDNFEAADLRGAGGSKSVIGII